MQVSLLEHSRVPVMWRRGPLSPWSPLGEVPRIQSFLRHKHIEYDFQGRLVSPGTAKGSWLRTAQPHHHRTLSSNHNLSVTTVRMFDTNLAHLLILHPSHSSSFLFHNNCAAHQLLYFACSCGLMLIFRIYSIGVSFSLCLFLLHLLSFVMKSFITNEKVCC